MEDERNTQPQQTGEADQVEVTDRGFFNHLIGKKEEKVEQQKHDEAELSAGMEKVSVEEPAEAKHEEHYDAEKHESLLTKLQRSSSSSSSSSDEEEEEEVIDDNGEVIKRKKKKGLKEKLKEKLPGHKDATAAEGQHATGLPAPAPPAALQTHHDTAVPVEKVETEAVPEEEKKGFLEKIKEKLPGAHKKPEDAAVAPAVTHDAPAPVHAPAPAAEEAVSSPDGKEKKGLLGKIMDKIPGYHKTPAAGEDDKAAAPAADHKTSA
ncbi:dehydrin COR410-like isoform X1 [Lolium rigidum]|uniref:dehydrin COR410-like isoform X1 n=1 Tax=Lolium rigidum TaxID=89674 RepID=UPI001F5C64C2|nr:dehydrin COR410-like isoform X1 [Lolium rigidum]